ncbi:MAG: hypothetical protein VSS52_012900, partial [Thiotrichaceae bacterium]|nr:hypothetical protein [Thiotrichaceae bacterium]
MNTLKLLVNFKASILAIIGIVLIFIAFYFSRDMNLQELLVTSIANIGALILVVGILQWLFDHQMREQMIREISNVVLGNTHIYDKGIIDCDDDSQNVTEDDTKQWTKAENLIIVAHYPEAFFSRYCKLFESRCQTGKSTTLLLSQPDGHGITYLKNIDPEVPNVEERVQRIIAQMTRMKAKSSVEIRLHSVVLHYLLIVTEQTIWVTPMLNSKGMSKVPVLKIRNNSPLYEIFYEDAQRLIEQSE